MTLTFLKRARFVWWHSCGYSTAIGCETERVWSMFYSWGLSHTGGDSRYSGKHQRQAIAQAEQQTDTCYQCLHLHASNTRAAIQLVLLHIWQSLEKWGQIVKMGSSSESSNWDINLVVVLMQQHLRVKKRPAKEEERFGVETALNYHPRCISEFWCFDMRPE